MNIYVESNFVLELALAQEQHEPCEAMLRLCEVGEVRLIIPAFSIAEPYQTLARRHKQRRRMKAELDQELVQLARTSSYIQQLDRFQDLTGLLIDSADEETKRLENTRSRLLDLAQIIPLDLEILTTSTRYQSQYDLSPPDALVFASVLSHLKQSIAGSSCFLNRNSRDFDNPHLVAELAEYHCKLLPRFDSGYQFVQSVITRSGQTDDAQST